MGGAVTASKPGWGSAVPTLIAVWRRLRALNPAVAVLELRMRMRGFRPFISLLAYTSLLALAALIYMLVAGQNSFRPDQSGTIGRDLFTVVSCVQLALVFLLLPGGAAGAIALEREKGTFELVRASLLRPVDIVTGKFAVLIAYGAILMASSLPLAAWCLLLGGIAPEEILLVYVHLVVTALWLVGLGLLFSAAMRRSIPAVVGTYGVILAMLGLPCLTVLLELAPSRHSWDHVIEYALAFWPATAPVSILMEEGPTGHWSPLTHWIIGTGAYFALACVLFPLAILVLRRRRV